VRGKLWFGFGVRFLLGQMIVKLTNVSVNSHGVVASLLSCVSLGTPPIPIIRIEWVKAFLRVRTVVVVQPAVSSTMVKLRQVLVVVLAVLVSNCMVLRHRVRRGWPPIPITDQARSNSVRLRCRVMSSIKGTSTVE